MMPRSRSSHQRDQRNSSSQHQHLPQHPSLMMTLKILVMMIMRQLLLLRQLWLQPSRHQQQQCPGHLPCLLWCQQHQLLLKVCGVCGCWHFIAAQLYLTILCKCL
jgi:hypothetical protein